MGVTATGVAFFFDVRDFAVGCHLAITADHAPARQRFESEEPHETHYSRDASNCCTDELRSFALAFCQEICGGRTLGTAGIDAGSPIPWMFIQTIGLG
jgi:hypothetical protein